MAFQIQTDNILFRVFAILAVTAFLNACGNGGSISFEPSPTPNPTINDRGADLTIVPASVALSIESGKTTANGYHAKLQLNPNKGVELTGSGYTLKMKHATRNR